MKQAAVKAADLRCRDASQSQTYETTTTQFAAHSRCTFARF
jgi:hypothetical protein